MRVSYYAGRGPVSTPVMVGRLCANPIETPYAPLLVTPRRNAIVCMGAKRMASLLGGHLLKGVGYFRRVTRHKDPPARVRVDSRQSDLAPTFGMVMAAYWIKSNVWIQSVREINTAESVGW